MPFFRTVRPGDGAYTTLTIPRFHGTTLTDSFHAKASILRGRCNRQIGSFPAFPPEKNMKNIFDSMKFLQKLHLKKSLKAPPRRIYMNHQICAINLHFFNESLDATWTWSRHFRKFLSISLFTCWGNVTWPQSNSPKWNVSNPNAIFFV